MDNTGKIILKNWKLLKYDNKVRAHIFKNVPSTPKTSSVIITSSSSIADVMARLHSGPFHPIASWTTSKYSYKELEDKEWL